MFSGEIFGRDLLYAFAGVCFCAFSISAQQAGGRESAVIVQPGAPGQPSQILPPSTRGKLPPRSAKDVEFMQGMIMHHAQAVEMTALIKERTENQDVRRLGARISQSQSDEMSFMKRWLENRGEKIEMMTSRKSASGMKISSRHQNHAQMPGMLTAKEMEALKNATGAEFDRLFLAGMIRHHQGALTMVKELFATGGAGQDAEIFNFATDVDGGQRAEIKIMQSMLGKKEGKP